MNRKLTTVAIVLLILSICGQSPAHAYFDANSGVYFLQIILGFAAVVWLTLKSSWNDFKKKPVEQMNSNTTDDNC